MVIYLAVNKVIQTLHIDVWDCNDYNVVEFLALYACVVDGYCNINREVVTIKCLYSLYSIVMYEYIFMKLILFYRII